MEVATCRPCALPYVIIFFHNNAQSIENYRDLITLETDEHCKRCCAAQLPTMHIAKRQDVLANAALVKSKPLQKSSASRQRTHTWRACTWLCTEVHDPHAFCAAPLAEQSFGQPENLQKGAVSGHASCPLVKGPHSSKVDAAAIRAKNRGIRYLQGNTKTSTALYSVGFTYKLSRPHMAALQGLLAR